MAYPQEKEGYRPTHEEIKAISERVGIPMLVTSKTLSLIFDIKLTTIEQFAREGVIPSVKIGSKRRYNPDQVRSWLEEKMSKDSRFVELHQYSS